MLAHVTSAALHGVESYLVRVEVNLAPGLPSFAVVGLPEGAVREGRERVATSLANAGHPLPSRRITVNLAPADVRKEGSAFDLPIAVGLLAGAGRVPADRLDGWAFVGELGLDGTLRPVRGVLAMAAAFRARGLRGVVVPRENALEAATVGGIEVLSAGSLTEVYRHLTGEEALRAVRVDAAALLVGPAAPAPDFGDVLGQEPAKRALELAAAGAHNVLMVGPPGAGKTMLARRVPGILPPLTVEEALEVTRIHSVAGRLPSGQGLVTLRPFRAPHHTTSDAGLVGGGSPPRPGEVSLAHHGVLFLDELPEFRRNVLESLRQPVEDGEVLLSRARASVRYPARFMLVAAMNPCPCGRLGDGTDRCTCDPAHVIRYRARVSGPLLDRIDLHVDVPAVPPHVLREGRRGTATAPMRARVAEARERQRRRLRGARGVFANGQMGPAEVRRHCRASPEVVRYLQTALERLALSARGYHRVLRMARTIADLEGTADVRPEHAAEALQYRSLDRRSALP